MAARRTSVAPTVSTHCGTQVFSRSNGQNSSRQGSGPGTCPRCILHDDIRVRTVGPSRVVVSPNRMLRKNLLRSGNVPSSSVFNQERAYCTRDNGGLYTHELKAWHKELTSCSSCAADGRYPSYYHSRTLYYSDLFFAWWNDCFPATFKHLLPCLTVTSTRDLENLLQQFHSTFIPYQGRAGGRRLRYSRLDCHKAARI